MIKSLTTNPPCGLQGEHVSIISLVSQNITDL